MHILQMEAMLKACSFLALSQQADDGRAQNCLLCLLIRACMTYARQTPHIYACCSMYELLTD